MSWFKNEGYPNSWWSGGSENAALNHQKSSGTLFSDKPKCPFGGEVGS